MGLRPENKGWGGFFTSQTDESSGATGLRSDVGETKCKNVNTASGEGLAWRTLLTPRESQYCLSEFASFPGSENAEKKLKSWDWGPPTLRQGQYQGNKSMRGLLLILPRRWQAEWQHACCDKLTDNMLAATVPVHGQKPLWLFHSL